MGAGQDLLCSNILRFSHTSDDGEVRLKGHYTVSRKQGYEH